MWNGVSVPRNVRSEFARGTRQMMNRGDLSVSISVHPWLNPFFAKRTHFRFPSPQSPIISPLNVYKCFLSQKHPLHDTHIYKTNPFFQSPPSILRILRISCPPKPWRRWMRFKTPFFSFVLSAFFAVKTLF